MINAVAVATRTSTNQDDFMKTMNTIPADHKLHKLVESHQEEVITLQLELEKMQKLNELENLKANMAREKQRLEKQKQHEELLEEQRRAAELIRVRLQRQ